MKRLACLTLPFALALAIGCDNSNPAPGGSGGSGTPAGTGGAKGTGGVTATGGTGAGTGGVAGGGTGGASGTGGTGTGGVAGTGGNATPGTGGGANTGGVVGTGGMTGTGGAAGDAGADSGPGPSTGLDECFAGLRKLALKSQLATKKSADGKHQVRLALERIPDSIGTSGTVPWRVVRVGFLTPSGTACVKDEAALAAAYKNSHHNCSDILTVTSAGSTYEVKTPDTSPGRPDATLTISGLATTAAVKLTQVTCMGDISASDPTCKSGGPCQ